MKLLIWWKVRRNETWPYPLGRFGPIVVDANSEVGGLRSFGKMALLSPACQLCY
jgi:hypothetical protein